MILTDLLKLEEEETRLLYHLLKVNQVLVEQEITQEQITQDQAEVVVQTLEAQVKMKMEEQEKHLQLQDPQLLGLAVVVLGGQT